MEGFRIGLSAEFLHVGSQYETTCWIAESRALSGKNVYSSHICSLETHIVADAANTIVVGNVLRRLPMYLSILVYLLLFATFCVNHTHSGRSLDPPAWCRSLSVAIEAILILSPNRFL
jgi:hypothetical protein